MISVVAFLAAAAFAMPSLQLQQTQSAIRAILPTFIETSPMPTDFILWETKKSTVRVCSRTDSIYTLASQSFAPNPLVKGKDVNVQSTGVFSRVIEDGAKYEFLGTTLLDGTFDLCKEIRAYGVTCPIPAGAFSFNHNVNVPGFAPSGTYIVDFTLRTSDGAEIGCVHGEYAV